MKSLKDVRVLSFRKHVADTGILTPYTAMTDIPMHIARVFCIWGVQKDASRGNHAHVACDQVLVSLRGECHVLCDDGTNKKVFALSAPDQGLYIPASIWSVQQDFVENAILMVFANLPYDEADYIRQYDHFLKFRATGRKAA